MKRLHLVTICILLAVSCSPRVITQVEIQRDTTYLTNHVRDSVYFRDSIYIKEQLKGDTVYIRGYRDRWRERIKEIHDTLIRTKVDSVSVEVPVEVEKKLPVGKKMKLNLFFPLVLLALVGWRKEIMKLLKHIVGLFV